MASNGSESAAISGSLGVAKEKKREKETIFTSLYWPSDTRALILFGVQNERAPARSYGVMPYEHETR